jgi:hypothetical protein
VSIFYLSIYRNAKSDIQATFIGGRLAALDGLDRPIDLFEDYAAGTSVILSAGFEWDGLAVISTPYVLRISDEDFESYALGSAGNGSGLTGATGWDGAPVIHSY